MSDLPDAHTDAIGPQADQAAVLSALDQMLDPLVQLCLEKGVTVQLIEEHLRQAVVRSARRICEQQTPDHPKHRLTSRISTMTGLTRREVDRLEAAQAPRRNRSRTRVSEMFARWLSSPEGRGPDGLLRPLPRTGPHPSFESLAAAVNKDVHARTLLAEMVRLGLVDHDTSTDQVALHADAFVPKGQWTQMLAFLADNVGDHLQAAVSNVLGQGDEHFEQALYADELSEHALRTIRPLIARQWQHLMTTLAPQLQALMDEDAAAGRPQTQAIRLGLYSLSQPMAVAAPTDPPKDTPSNEGA